MRAKERMAALIALLEELYPSAECALKYGGDPWRLLVMGRLSAQCTDARVNEVCVELFRELPTVYDFAEAPLFRIEELIRSCGLFRMKAQNLQDAARLLITEYGGEVPDSMDELLKIPGIGRKIANLLLGDLFGQPAIVADTHCIRLAARFGFVPKGEKDPYKVEKALAAITPPEKSADLCHRIVFFGREVCTARNPHCDGCPARDLCKSKGTF